MFEIITDRYTLQGRCAELIHEILAIEGTPEAWKQWVKKCEAKGLDFTEFWERREAQIVRRPRRDNGEFSLSSCIVEERIIRNEKGKLLNTIDITLGNRGMAAISVFDERPIWATRYSRVVIYVYSILLHMSCRNIEPSMGRVGTFFNSRPWNGIHGLDQAVDGRTNFCDLICGAQKSRIPDGSDGRGDSGFVASIIGVSLQGSSTSGAQFPFFKTIDVNDLFPCHAYAAIPIQPHLLMRLRNHRRPSPWWSIR
jgi:hypothetical protein